MLYMEAQSFQIIRRLITIYNEKLGYQHTKVNHIDENKKNKTTKLMLEHRTDETKKNPRWRPSVRKQKSAQ